MVERSTNKNMKISVITATYNSALTLVDTINSLNIQDYPDIEYIIVDGASTDSTLKIVEQYGHRVTTLISQKDNGIYDALNKGIALATGDVVGFLHSDDLFADEKVISRIVKKFYSKTTDAVYGDLDYVSKADKERVVRRWVSGNYSRENIKSGWMPPHPTFYMRRKYYEILGGFDLKFKISADYDSILRYLWENEINAEYIPHVLIKMRVGGKSNKSLTNILQKSTEDWHSLKKNGIPLARALIGKNLSKIGQFF